MIIVITGPTGVGKTKLSIELAKRYNAEIINGDAIQVYRGLDIGSAKISIEEMDNVKHHLFDIRDVSEEYSIYDYQNDCRKVIDDILSRDKNVIIVGGTGLYIKSALYDYTLEGEDYNNNQYDDVTTDELYNRLKDVDKDIEIDRFNRRRIIRALNYYLTYNKSISENNRGNDLLYDDVLFIGLTTDRDILYKKINDRVDVMLNNGLINEVKSFYDMNMRYKPLLGGIGYKELYSYLDNEISLDGAIELIKRNSRRYAKRQYTFFNNQFNIKWFDVDFDNFNNTIDNVCNYINEKE
jgi:tRNA dimethylallyltransferase